MVSFQIVPNVIGSSASSTERIAAALGWGEEGGQPLALKLSDPVVKKNVEELVISIQKALVRENKLL